MVLILKFYGKMGVLPGFITNLFGWIRRCSEMCVIISVCCALR